MSIYINIELNGTGCLDLGHVMFGNKVKDIMHTMLPIHFPIQSTSDNGYRKNLCDHPQPILDIAIRRFEIFNGVDKL